VAIAGGDLIKQIDHQIAMAVENCLDPNTAPKSKRKVVVTITLEPNDTREHMSVEGRVEAKLAGDVPVVDLATLSRTRKSAYVKIGKQMSIDEVIAVQKGVNDAEGSN